MTGQSTVQTAPALTCSPVVAFWKLSVLVAFWAFTTTAPTPVVPFEMQPVAGTDAVIVQALPAVFSTICAPPVVGMVSVALKRTLVALVPELLVTVKIMSRPAPPAWMYGWSKAFVSTRVLVTATLRMSEPVGPTVGV